MAFFNCKKEEIKEAEFTTDLDREVHRYLSMDTSYAFLITGPWGSGKTYYFENVLRPNVIDRTEVFGNAQYRYKCVRISLFGIETLGQLYSEFFIELYPRWKSKYWVIGKPIIKILIRAAIYFRNKGEANIDDFSKEIDKITQSVVNVEHLVICLDDLERKSEKITLDILTGFINTLVENGNVKVLILANEDKIDNDYYKRFKEKIIGITIPFKQDSEKILESIIRQRFNSEKKFTNWLTNYLAIILEVFQKQDSPNFRSLIYGLGTLQLIFSETVLKKGEEVLSDDWKVQWESIIGFTIAASFEFKNNKFRYGDENFNLLKIMGHGTDIANINPNFLSLDNETEIDERYSVWFKQTYSSELFKFYAYPSILSFITRGESFSPDSLMKELSKSFPEGTVDPKIQLLNSLSNRNVGKYSDSDFCQAINQLINYIKNGEMGYSDTLTAFNLIYYYNDIFRFDLDNIVADFKNGMKKASERPHSVNSENLAIDLDIDSTDFKLNSYLHNLSSYVEQLNNEAWTKEIDKYVNDLQEFLESDHEKFLEHFSLNRIGYGQNWALLHKLDKDIFWQNFKNFNNQNIYSFALILSKRYRSALAPKHYAVEIDFLVFLSDKIENLLSSYPKTLSWKMYKNTNEQIKKALEKLNQN